MPGPIQTLRFVHTAISTEAERIEAALIAAADGAALAPLLPDVEWFVELCDLHMKGEEVGMFPRLAEAAPHIDDTYLFEHAEERRRLAELLALVRAGADGDATALPALKRLGVSVTEHARSHIDKENELIVPFIEAHFSPPEQGAMMQAIVGAIPPEKVARAVPFIIDRLELDDATSYLRALAAGMPAPVFEKARGWIADGVTADKVAALRERVPEL